jgi:AraC-like DNA-binding protein
MMRGGAAGVSLILAATLLQRAAASSIARFGALFAFGAACYAAASGPAVAEALPGLVEALKPFAMATGVFFWWFALALFCDVSRWHWTRLIPFVIVVVCAILSPAGVPLAISGAAHITAELLNAALMVHVIVIIANGASDDLVEPRRKFRTGWIGAIALTVLAVALAEIWKSAAPLPGFMHVIEAAAILIVTCGVTGCCLAAQEEFFPADRRPEPGRTEREPGVAAADRHLAAALRTAMDAGVWREPGLTVGALADRLGAPEHRLRVVINQQLGYRNFAAFLNEHRVEAAKSALADPAQARRQVLQIALDLGYGSIAPFNRAFRAAVGRTPTEYRRDALEAGDARAPAAAE